MTGLERNADEVIEPDEVRTPLPSLYMSEERCIGSLINHISIALQTGHVEGWQWRPDLIWFDNLSSVRSANYYVQQLYGENKGDVYKRQPVWR